VRLTRIETCGRDVVVKIVRKTAYGRNRMTPPDRIMTEGSCDTPIRDLLARLSHLLMYSRDNTSSPYSEQVICMWKCKEDGVFESNFRVDS
jgi:hypothetical protein